MFTGFIDHCGEILAVEPLSVGKRLLIACNYEDLAQGESIAINGACLTVSEHDNKQFWCDLSPETLAATAVNQLMPGDLVNLERSLKINDRLHGHFVLGHVDQVCKVVRKKVLEDFTEYAFDGVLADKKNFLVKKGSIAINGVSLTLNDIMPDAFDVMLIPETLRKTNLGLLKIGDSVNVEYDYLAKIICNKKAL
jgi:riboflavin synthase